MTTTDTTAVDAVDGGTDREYLLVTEYFHPDTASTGVLMTDLAVGLRERRLDVSVLTGQPNYHSGDNERQPRRSVHRGVPVSRARVPLVRQTSLVRRLYNWVAFTLWVSAVLLLSRPAPGRERHLVFVSNPPFLPVALWVVARVRGWSYTYVVYDLYPDNLVALGMLSDGLIARLWSGLHRRALRRAESVVALGPAMKARLVGLAGAGFDPGRVVVVHNWQDETFVVPRAKADNWFAREHDLVDRFTVTYSGNMGTFHDLDTLVRAAARVEDPDVHFLLVGEGDNRRHVVSLAADLGLGPDRITFLPYQDWADIPYSLTASDAMVVTVQAGFEGLCVSSKLYTAMATGRPVLCIAAPDADEARIVAGFDAGVAVPQGDAAGVVDAVAAWRADPERHARQGDNARAAFEERFTRDRSVDRYHTLLTRGPAAVAPDVTERPDLAAPASPPASDPAAGSAD
jgi:glycosyltransferase involved in cell wall biosynthesis